MRTLKNEVSGRATFQFYRDGALYYKTDSGLIFSVPITDTGRGTFLPEDKAMFFMRWIRPALEALGEDTPAESIPA